MAYPAPAPFNSNSTFVAPTMTNIAPTFSNIAPTMTMGAPYAAATFTQPTYSAPAPYYAPEVQPMMYAQPAAYYAPQVQPMMYAAPTYVQQPQYIAPTIAAPVEVAPPAPEPAQIPALYAPQPRRIKEKTTTSGPRTYFRDYEIRPSFQDRQRQLQKNDVYRGRYYLLERLQRQHAEEALIPGNPYGPW
eukprot:NODE_3638_length_942_cov_43.342665_g3341_i0.p1 GENE.NODE_3638_length_942_cov_43.342665_g3341_i0~~NODE_3638_length_942_cov_43.342665_g3341_i0.p1  ORF type:complete len:189 (+),score=29.85 NODE_3638_length_942_cov_43.342665_g3341_i0:137-703(+)